MENDEQYFNSVDFIQMWYCVMGVTEMDGGAWADAIGVSGAA